MDSIVVTNTPVELLPVGGKTVFVKREDLCCPGGPPFSKTRGVAAHIAARPEETIGVLDTFHSKAGWAVAFAGSLLGRKVINYYAKYKRIDTIQPQQVKAFELGAELLHLPAGRSSVLFHQAKRHLAETYPGAYMMPNALKLPESITENAKEAEITKFPIPIKTLILSISSGTVAAGVIKGIRTHSNPRIVLHMGYSRSEASARAYMEASSGEELSEALFVDEGYSYGDQVKDIQAPFPCNPFYDLKAWKWLMGNVDFLEQPILFWNIGD